MPWSDQDHFRAFGAKKSDNATHELSPVPHACCLDRVKSKNFVNCSESFFSLGIEPSTTLVGEGDKDFLKCYMGGEGPKKPQIFLP